jgi:hypothetical protein
VSRQKCAAHERGEAFDPDRAKSMPVGTRLLFGGLAGLFAQSVTYPLDIVRRRIQVVGKAGGYSSPWKVGALHVHIHRNPPGAIQGTALHVALRVSHLNSGPVVHHALDQI